MFSSWTNMFLARLNRVDPSFGVTDVQGVL